MAIWRRTAAERQLCLSDPANPSHVARREYAGPSTRPVVLMGQRPIQLWRVAAFTACDAETFDGSRAMVRLGSYWLGGARTPTGHEHVELFPARQRL